MSLVVTHILSESNNPILFITIINTNISIINIIIRRILRFIFSKYGYYFHFSTFQLIVFFYYFLRRVVRFYFFCILSSVLSCVLSFYVCFLHIFLHCFTYVSIFRLFSSDIFQKQFPAYSLFYFFLLR